MVFAMHERNKRGCDALVAEGTRVDRHLMAPMTTLLALESKSGGLPKTLINHTSRFERQYSLYQWMQSPNDNQRVAPATATVKNTWQQQ